MGYIWSLLFCPVCSHNTWKKTRMKTYIKENKKVKTVSENCLKQPCKMSLVLRLDTFMIEAYSGWTLSTFGVFLVHIFSHSDWIRRDTVSFRIRSECRKIRTRKAPNTDTFHAVISRNLSNIYDGAFLLKIVHALYVNIIAELISNLFVTSSLFGILSLYKAVLNYNNLCDVWL